jgi:hypothetical protein
MRILNGMLALTARRLVFFGAHALVAYSAVVSLWLPFANWSEERQAALQSKREMLARFEAVASQDAAVQEFLAQVDARNASGELLPAQNESVASAELQARLKSVATTHGVVVRSIRALPNLSTGTAQLIGVRLEFMGPIEAVRELVHAIEFAPTLFVVREAALRGQTVPRGVQAAAAPALDVTLDVFGGFVQRAKT